MAVFSGYAASNCWRRSSAVVSTTPMTFACWAQVAQAAATSSMIEICNSASSGNNDQWRLLLRSTAVVSALTGASAALSQADATRVARSRVPFHAAAVFTSATDRRAYFNGAWDANQTTSRVPTSPNRTSIGLNDNAANASQFGAAADDWMAWPAIWNVALARREIVALASGVPPLLIRPEALVFYNDGSVARGLLIDRSRAGNHMSVVGSLNMLPEPAFMAGLRYRGRSQVGQAGTQFSQSVPASNSALAALVNSAGKPLRATNSAVTSEVLSTGKIARANDAAVAALARSTAHAANANDAAVGRLAMQTGKPLQAADAASASLSATRVTLLSALASSAPVAALARATAAVRQVSTAAAASLVRSTAKAFQSSSAAVASLSAIKVVLKSIAASTAPVAALVRQSGLVRQAATAAGATLARAVAIVRRVNAAAAATLARQAAKTALANDAAVASAAAIRIVLLSLLASTAPAASVVRAIALALRVVTAPAATLARGFALVLRAAASAVASCVALFVAFSAWGKAAGSPRLAHGASGEAILLHAATGGPYVIGTAGGGTPDGS